MVASALVVLNQINYIRSKDIGYDRKQVISFYAEGDILSRFDAFKTEIERLPGVQVVSRSDNSLVHVNNQNRSVRWPGRAADDNSYFRTVVVDYQFLETMGLGLVEGRFFNAGMADTASFVVTEKAVEAMGLDNPLGTPIEQWNRPGKIVGVVKDFHSRSMHDAIDPIIFMYRPDWGVPLVFVKYDPGKTKEVLSGIENVSKQFAPDYPFNYTFLDEDFERLYNTDKVTGSLAIGFTFIAIIISGLGLLGLAAYTAERKRKEISIRKTLGATVGGLVTLMAREFARLSLLAAIIGCPIAWYLMTMFLDGYEYHVELSVGVFLLTAFFVVLIALITVIFQVARAAIANPVDALRNE